MDAIKLSVELDKIVNDLLHITMGVTFNDIYTSLQERTLAEKSEKIVADDIYMNFRKIWTITMKTCETLIENQGKTGITFWKS